MTKGPVMAETFHVRNMLETAIIRTVEKIEPATMYPHSRGVAAKKVGSAQPTRIYPCNPMLMFSLGALRA